MCGIAGILANENSDVSVVRGMIDALKHRGPDGDGVYKECNPFIALGHTRLSIIDLSDNGAQPKISLSGRYVVTFNGEIYNHLKLRQQVEQKLRGSISWKGSSDTETLLMCFECFGVVESISKIMGMYAIAVWDKKKYELILIRDRFGEKPLYYSKFSDLDDNLFVFASDIRAIRGHEKYSGEISATALSYFSQYNYIPAPYTIYDNIYKLDAGSYMSIKYIDGRWRESEKKEIEWADIFSNDDLKEIESSFRKHQTINYLDDLLVEVVRELCISDVPIGSFLSGGIDSTLITAIMQKVNDSPINTFTIGSDDQLYDESKYSNVVANYLGTNHHEFILTSSDAIDVIPDLCNIYDEPFADSSQIPMVLLSRYARQFVSVSLSGDGGDEIFGGYNRHVWGESIFNFINRIPYPLRSTIGGMMKYFSRNEFEDFINKVSLILPSSIRVSLPSDKIRKISNAINCKSQIELYQSLVRVSDPRLMSNNFFINDLAKISNYWDADSSFAENAMTIDRRTYLSDDILVKTDRAAMSVGLENRSPFLDSRIVAFSDLLPAEYKIQNKQGKWILRKLLDSYVPEDLMNRPKTGFSIPIGSWLRGPLKEWAADLLSKENITKYGYLDYKYVSGIWKAHLAGSEMHNELWGAIVLQSWLDSQYY